MVTKRKLALDAIKVEQEIVGESVGSQDQTSAAFGGLNRIEFGGPQHITVYPVTLNPKRLHEFEGHLMLFFTGLSRTASEMAAAQIKNLKHRITELTTMREMVDEAQEILMSNASLNDFGKLLHEGWQLKKSLSSKITTSFIDDIYITARKAGATGGKLLGAGGGGFILFFVKPELQPKVKKSLKHFLHVPFTFEHFGSQVIYYVPEMNA